MNAIKELFSKEPILILGLIEAMFALAVAFGAPLSEGQKVAVLAVAVAFSKLYARSKVTPVARFELESYETDGVELPGPDPKRRGFRPYGKTDR